MQRSLKVVTPASTKMLLDPADVKLRIKGTDDDLPEITRTIARLSAMIVARIGRELALQEYEESFRYVDQLEMRLSVLPILDLTGGGVWSPDVDPTKNVILQEGVDFELQQENDLLFKPDGWGLGFIGDWMTGSTMLPATVVPDWIVRYRAGFWLPGMTGTKPAGARDLRDDYDSAAWYQFQHMWTLSRANPQVTLNRKAGAETRYAKPTAWHPIADEILLGICVVI